MIMEHCFTKAWIDGFKSQEAYCKINPPLVEKMIHALSLLQHLKHQGLNFVFKGGTSLVILLEKANRFSVDIDIITEESRKYIEEILDKVVNDHPFIDWKLDERRSYKPGVPKAHYEIKYESSLNRNANYVLLDILFERTHYPQLQERPIQSIWIETREIVKVNLPTIEAITGDKLTAFAPTTTGILYGRRKELEIIKQLFDLGHLFDHIKAIEIVAASFLAFAQQEITYRSKPIETKDVLLDGIEACRVICFRERNQNEPDKTYYEELQKGIRSFSNYLISGYFRINEAVTAAGKVAYLNAKLLKEEYNPLLKYRNQDLRGLEIKNQKWNQLNKLKRLPDQAAFFYWYQCLTILNEVN